MRSLTPVVIRSVVLITLLMIFAENAERNEKPFNM
jgi:CBS-domain-containing membrane protein